MHWRKTSAWAGFRSGKTTLIFNLYTHARTQTKYFILGRAVGYVEGARCPPNIAICVGSTTGIILWQLVAILALKGTVEGMVEVHCPLKELQLKKKKLSQGGWNTVWGIYVSLYPLLWRPPDFITSSHQLQTPIHYKTPIHLAIIITMCTERSFQRIIFKWLLHCTSWCTLTMSYNNMYELWNSAFIRNTYCWHLYYNHYGTYLITMEINMFLITSLWGSIL